jgi:zinc protease
MAFFNPVRVAMSKLRQRLGLAPWVALALSMTAVQVLAETYEKTLDNGLKLIVKEDRRAPTAVQMVWYRAGSMDEVDGQSGVAHVLEHMMFKGTPNFGPGEFNKRVAAAGGRDNAFTSRDYTAYFQQVPKDKLEEMMKLEADRMYHLSLEAKEFASELKVVIEERRLRTEDEPTARLHEQMNGVVFQASPYRRPVIGWMNDLENMTVEDAKDWYNTWYVPNNAVVVIVGDVDYPQVLKWADKYYGGLPPGVLPKRRPQEEPPQQGVRRLTVKAPADLPQVVLSYKVPGIRDVEKDVDPFALDVLSSILDGHDAARFTRRLVKESRLAVSANAGYDGLNRGPAVFQLSGAPAPGKNIADLEAALRAEVAKVASDGVSEAELQRARAQLIASETYKRDSMFAQAMEMGMMETVGFSWRDTDRIIARLKTVTAAQVKDVAARYFSDDVLTVAVLDPQPMQFAPRKAVPGLRH